jgi:hypothetical protein
VFRAAFAADDRALIWSLRAFAGFAAFAALFHAATLLASAALAALQTFPFFAFVRSRDQTSLVGTT